MPETKPQLTIVAPHNNDTVNLSQPFPVGGQVTKQFVSGDLVLIDSVTVRVDNGPVTEAQLTPVNYKTQTKVNLPRLLKYRGARIPTQ